jgi:ABC-type Mn2+/Zn2+ transport system permease subunit
MVNPFAFDFLRDALWVGLTVGTVCAVLSCYLVLKGWSLMGDAVSHAVLPGIVLAYLAGLPIFLGAFVSGLFCAVATGYLKANSRIKEDTVMGIVFTGLFGLGLILFSKVTAELHLDHILFGNILGLEENDVTRTLWIGGAVLTVILVLRKNLMLFCFDPLHARSLGLNTTGLYYLLLSLLAGTIVVSMEAVGIILVIAMLITPGCVGYLLTSRFERMMALSVFSAWISFFLGIYVSFLINGSTAACIVLVQSLQFAAAMVFSRQRLLSYYRRELIAPPAV